MGPNARYGEYQGTIIYLFCDRMHRLSLMILQLRPTGEDSTRVGA